jgi:HEAT repeat protein
MLDKLLREHKAPPGGRPLTADLTEPKLHKLNRLLLDAAFPRHIRPGPALRPLGIRRRDAAACCHLLGARKSRRGYDVLLDLLGSLPVDSRAMSAAAAAAARIGDARAAKPLTQAVRTCRANGLRYLIARAAMQPPPDPYEEHAAGGIVQSLGELGGPKAAEEILAIANTQFQDACLVRPATAAARVLPGLTTPTNRQGVRAFLLAAVRAEGYPMRVRLAAAKAAAGLKLREALPELRDMLQDERESRTMVHVAAWAIQEITGQTPALTEPKSRPGDWIIRAIRSTVRKR